MLFFFFTFLPWSALAGERQLKSEPLGIICDSLATEKVFEWEGRFKINLNLLAGKLSAQEFARQVVAEQLRYWQGPYPYKHQTRGILQLNVDPSTLSVDILKSKKVVYGNSFKIGRSPRFLMRLSNANSNDPALFVHYHARARFLVCAQGEAPFPKIISLPLPEDPYLFFWSLPSVNQRHFQDGPTWIKTNPCSTSPQQTSKNPETYPEFWNPKRFRFDDRNEFFDCESLLKDLFFDAQISEAPPVFQKNSFVLGQFRSLESLFERARWDKTRTSHTQISAIFALPLNQRKSLSELEDLRELLTNFANDPKISTLFGPRVTLLLRNLKYILERYPASSFASTLIQKGLEIDLTIRDKDALKQTWRVTYLVTFERSSAAEALSKSMQADPVTIYIGDRISEAGKLLSQARTSYKLVALFAPQQLVDLSTLKSETREGFKTNIVDVISTPGNLTVSDLALNLMFESVLNNGNNLTNKKPIAFTSFFAPRPHFITFNEEFFFRLERLSWVD